jgi:hypothetical protein
MKTSPQYTRIAHRRTVVRMLQEHLKEKYIEMGGFAARREPLICEDVMYTDRVVSQDALLEVLDALEQFEVTESLEMTKFEVKERDMPRLRLPTPQRDADVEEPVEGKNQSSTPGQEASKGGDSADRAAPEQPPTGAQSGGPSQ